VRQVDVRARDVAASTRVADRARRTRRWPREKPRLRHACETRATSALEDEVREQMSHRSTRGVRKGIRGGVNSDHEGVRSRALHGANTDRHLFRRRPPCGGTRARARV